ncbi:MAG: NUDIX domain-containing protein [Bacteroidales bacterium]
MYKVFYNERTVFFIDDFQKYFDKYDGLFYKFKDKPQLSHVLDLFNGVPGFSDLYICHKDLEFVFSEYRSLFTLVEAAGGLVFAPDETVLFIKRRGLWDLPKGKLELNEKIEMAALREVEEECGVTNLIIADLIEITYHTYQLTNKNILKKTYWYKMKVREKGRLVPQTKEDITEAKWIKPSKIGKITQNTFPSIIEVLTKGGVIK